MRISADPGATSVSAIVRCCETFCDVSSWFHTVTQICWSGFYKALLCRSYVNKKIKERTLPQLPVTISISALYSRQLLATSVEQS